ncbi:PorT family protein [Antarcticibacterium arcticum]|uniref:PorT family protein n=1 Tax=Antarcticibacterium arcticum TaxID=2585771 RepID=A0A5B8YJH3_9FLAO|nr:porin family protein [Antarcticibacterium arcticum]QED36773.1 PorT family protein [Antarcticibacterium arcticum]
MKNHLLIVIISLMSLGGAQAQEYFNFGVKGGVNFATLTGDDADELDAKMKTGFHLGVLAEIMISDKFGIQPEVLYSSQGAKSDVAMFEEFGGNVDVDIKLDYIAVPVMLKYFVAPGFSLEAGPQFSFLSKSEIEAEFGGETETEDIKDDTESFDLGAAFGVGYGLPQGFLVQARYVMGFSDVYTDSDARNSVIQLSVGWKF